MWAHQSRECSPWDTTAAIASRDRLAKGWCTRAHCAHLPKGRAECTVVLGCLAEDSYNSLGGILSKAWCTGSWPQAAGRRPGMVVTRRPP